MRMWRCAVLLLPFVAVARTVTTGTIVANPGATVSMPLTIDDMSGVAAAVVTVNYDSTVLVCLGVDAGAIVREGKFSYLDSGNGRLVAIFSGFEGDGAMGASRPAELMNIRFSVRDGTQGLFSDVTVEGSVEIVAESGELPSETVVQIRTVLAGTLTANPTVKSVTVKGDVATIPVTVDLGIAPRLDILGTTAMATYATPTIRIIDFTPATGAVRIKVTPGEGNVIRSTLATGCIHVYGTDNLAAKMRYISGTSFDLTPYLKAETIGEADLTVALGTHTFIKIKAETSVKQEGEQEQ